MARPASVHPTEFELEILKVLWESSPLTVREIRDSMAEAGRDSAHTTVITILNIMVDKKYLKKKKQGKGYLFWPVVSEENVSTKMLGDIVNRVFSGSAKSLILNLLDGDEDIDEDELKELRKRINQKMKEQKK